MGSLQVSFESQIKDDSFVTLPDKVSLQVTFVTECANKKCYQTWMSLISELVLLQISVAKQVFQ